MSETLQVPYQRANHATGIITADMVRNSVAAGERSVRVIGHSTTAGNGARLATEDIVAR